MNRMQALLPVMLVSFLISQPCMGADADAANKEALQVSEHNHSFVLSVPVSRLTLTIPKGNFSRQKNTAIGAAHSPRYFNFADAKQGIIVSGWFEPASSYSNFDKLWHDEKESWRSTNLPAPENETLFKSGNWEAVAYDISLPEQKANSSNIRAFLVQSGTWIDLHLSLTSKAGGTEAREKLMGVLKNIQVAQHP